MTTKHGRRPSEEETHHNRRPSGSPSSASKHHEETPLPKRQLAVLAIVALAEQTALNSISPYLPEMASTFPEVEPDKVGLYVGLIASAFALAQFLTNFAWGWASDRLGRKPILMCGTFLTGCCLVAFGFCRTLWQAIIVQAGIGLVNGNQGVVSTCLGEITDRSNQSRAFTYLPVIYGLGGITGPLLGGLLVMKQDPFHPGQQNPYPYLLPNLVSAAILAIDLVIVTIFLEESLEGAKELPRIKDRVGSLFAWLWQFTSSHKPTYLKHAVKHPSYGTSSPVRTTSNTRQQDGDNHRAVYSSGDTDDSDGDEAETSPLLISSQHHGHLAKKQIFNRDTLLLLGTFLIFQLANISYNSLYPIFAQAQPPTGRDLNPKQIGISLGFTGAITIVFQVFVFGRLREKMGNKTTYRSGLGLFVVAFLLMPWIGYKDGTTNGSKPSLPSGTTMLWIELGVVLILKTVAAVGGLTSALLLITNSASSHAVLGTLNGLAQTLSAAGRAVGPFISGSLFSLATRVHPKGEAMAFGVFGGISFVGFLLSFGIRGKSLEAEGFDSDDDDDEAGDRSSHSVTSNTSTTHDDR